MIPSRFFNFALFSLVATGSIAGSVAVGRSLAADPNGTMAHTQAVCLVAMASLGGASLVCAGAAATDK
jgi:hypothetical protein